jgi:hypothetical protein
MTSVNPATHGSVMPFKRYIDATHAARDQYLNTTYHAHRMYLTGPWPDRETYQQVENTAWRVYYTASREAWQRYTSEVEPPEPLPARVPGAAIRHVCIATPCPECGYNQDRDPAATPSDRPWPAGYDVPGPSRPTYPPNQDGTELWRSN